VLETLVYTLHDSALVGEGLVKCKNFVHKGAAEKMNCSGNPDQLNLFSASLWMRFLHPTGDRGCNDGDVERDLGG
jgi:hypothetical protein